MAAQTVSARGSGPFSSLPESRELDERLLDESQFRLHVARLIALTDEREGTLKRTADSLSESAHLEELVLPLIHGTIFGAQVRYVLEDKQWLETFVSTAAGVRLVRIELND